MKTVPFKLVYEIQSALWHDHGVDHVDNAVGAFYVSRSNCSTAHHDAVCPVDVERFA